MHLRKACKYSVKTGKYEKGNVEIWGNDYSGGNTKNIPGATKRFDFGDAVATNGNFGCLQVHNFQEKQTVLAFNHLRMGDKCDLGISNNTKGSPDWTFAKNAGQYKDAVLYIVAKIDNMTIQESVQLDPNQISLIGVTDKDPALLPARRTDDLHHRSQGQGRDADSRLLHPLGAYRG